ncbi:MAG: RCC1 domain-containing protein [Eubacteriales bacterium]
MALIRLGEDKINEWSNIIAISGEKEHTVGLKANGTVVAKEIMSLVNAKMDWTNIIAIACGPYHTVGLKSDGTLVATGNNDYGQCDVKGIDLW